MKEINESKQIIAKYEGFNTWTTELGTIMIENDRGSVGRISDFDQFEYNEDWNYLIPVAKRVLETLWGNENVKHPDTYVYNNLYNAVKNLEIDEVFKRTVDGVKLINKLNEQTK